MGKRGAQEKPELLVRIATERNLGLLVAVMLASLVLVGSPSGLPSPPHRLASPAPSVGGASATLGAEGAGFASSALGTQDPGLQVEDRGLYYTAYVIKAGDTVGNIAESLGASVDGIISLNAIQSTRNLRIGQVIKVPSMAGIAVSAKAGDTVDSLATAYGIGANGIIEANGLLSPELLAGKIVFLPDAQLPSYQLREINGDLFHWPVRGWISSRFGWRSDPFTGSRTFHNGLDIAADLGTPIGAAMEGRVVETGYSSSFGNYVLISHHSGWQSFYGHMNSISVRSGQAVGMGQRIGYVGTTGYSTGPHLHFSVFKTGRTMNPTVVLH